MLEMTHYNSLNNAVMVMVMVMVVFVSCGRYDLHYGTLHIKQKP
jgi:hypothetical protein